MKKILLFSCLLTIGLLSTAQNVFITPKVTQTEGQGNGGRFLYLSDETRNDIMAGAPWKVQDVTYHYGGGPILVKVVDPQQIHTEYDYRLKILPVTDAYDNSLISNDAHWKLEVLNSNGDVVEAIQSQHTIGEGIEEEIQGHGISIQVKNRPFSIYRENSRIAAAYPNVTYSNNVQFAQSDLIGSYIAYGGGHYWLSGIKDEEINTKNNWIRAGHHELGYWYDWGGGDGQDGVEDEYWKWRQEDYFYLMNFGFVNSYEPIRLFNDYYGQYEDVIDGTWAPYPLASAYDNGPQAKYISPDLDITSEREPSPYYYDFTALRSVPMNPGYNPTLTNLYSVDIVFTPDTSMWTRAVVLEAGAASAEDNFQVEQHFNGQTYHNIRHEPKTCPSVDKNGNPDNSGTTGMGWFPGYAINVETGERLNIMFAENSADEANHGADMIFNPTTDAEHWGGCHFVYVCGSSGSTCSMPYRNSLRARNFNDNGQVTMGHGGTFTGEDGLQYAYFDCGIYDEGKWLKEKFATFTSNTNFDNQDRKKRKMQLFNNVMWTSIPMPAIGEEAYWLSDEATVHIRVTRPFMYYSSAVGSGPESPLNNNAPAYSFNLRDLEPIAQSVLSQVDLDETNIIDINNIEALISPIGMHFWDYEYNYGSSNLYRVPKNGTTSSYFSQALWFGGLDESDQLHLAAMRFGQKGKDFWPGPLSTVDASTDESTTSQWDRCFKITRDEVVEFIANYDTPGYTIPKHILEWPAHGDTTKGQAYNLAPYVDVDNDNHYDPTHGDYPTFLGDMALFFIFNDNYAAHRETGGTPIGMEVHGMAYAFDAPNDSLLNNTLFFNYKMYNRSQNSLHNTYLGLWSDWDLGYANDDYVACDVQRSTVYCYNGRDIDNGYWNYTADEYGNIIDSSFYIGDYGYGANPPIQTLTVLAGPTMPTDSIDNPAYSDTSDCNLFVNNGLSQYAITGANFGNGITDDERLGLTGFLYHTNDGWGDPSMAEDYYHYLCGEWKDGTHLKYGGNAHYSNGGSSIDCNFMFPGNSDPCLWNTNGLEPDSAYQYGPEGWTEKAVGNAPYDRRGLAMVGPFDFAAGSMQEIDFCLSTIFPSFIDSSSKVDLSLLSFVDLLRDNYEEGAYSENFTEPVIITSDESICEGGSFDFYGRTITEAGSYTHNVRNALGTSIDTSYVLNLSFVPSYQLIYAAVLPNHSYNDAYFSIPASSTTTSGVQIHQTDVTSENGCVTTMILYLDVRTDVGIDEHLKVEDLTMYPNPTTGLVSFRIEDEELLNSNETVRVYDLSGRLLQSCHLTSETMTVNLSDYSSGLYLIKVGQYLGKIIKK